MDRVRSWSLQVREPLRILDPLWNAILNELQVLQVCSICDGLTVVTKLLRTEPAHLAHVPIGITEAAHLSMPIGRQIDPQCARSGDEPESSIVIAHFLLIDEHENTLGSGRAELRHMHHGMAVAILAQIAR